MRLPTTNQINCQNCTPFEHTPFYFLFFDVFLSHPVDPQDFHCPLPSHFCQEVCLSPSIPVLPFAWNTSPFYSPSFLVQPNIFVSCFQIESLRSTQTFLLIITLMLTTFNLPKNNKIRNIQKKKPANQKQIPNSKSFTEKCCTPTSQACLCARHHMSGRSDSWDRESGSASPG